MTQEQWTSGWMRSIALLFNGNTLEQMDDMGQPVVDDSFLILLNSYHDSVTYTLPPSPKGRGWALLMDTSDLEKPFKNKRLDRTDGRPGPVGGAVKGTDSAKREVCFAGRTHRD